MGKNIVIKIIYFFFNVFITISMSKTIFKINISFKKKWISNFFIFYDILYFIFFFFNI